MGVRIGRVVAAIGVAVAAMFATNGAASAQIPLPPLPVLPPLPPQATPALLVVSPIGAPICGTAGSLAVAGPTLVPVPGAAPIIGYAAGPVFVVCGNVPVPDSASELICAQDDQFLAALSTVTLLALGSGPPVATRVVGPAVESARVLESLAPAEVQNLGLAGLLHDGLACRAAHPVAAAKPPAAVADASNKAVDESVPDLTLGDDSFALGDVTGAVDKVISDYAQPEVRPAGAVAAARPFDYPLVFVVPLLLLAVGGYLARSLTEDVRLPA